MYIANSVDEAALKPGATELYAQFLQTKLSLNGGADWQLRAAAPASTWVNALTAGDAVTGATTDRIMADDLVRQLTSDAMRESARVGERLGIAIAQTPEERHAITRKLGAFKTSMLQDAEAGRAIELDSLVGAVRELGQHVGVPTPLIDAIYGLARLHGRVHGLYPPAAEAGAAAV